MARAKQTLDDFKGDYLSVRMFGAKGDCIIVKDGEILHSSFTFESASSTFKTSDVGKTIWIEGAGASGGDLLSTIAERIDAHTVLIANSASTDVTGALTRYGTDDTAAIQAAFDQAQSSDDFDDPDDNRGRRLVIPDGVYLTTAALNLRHNLSVRGSGFHYHVYGLKSATRIVCCVNAPVMQYTSTSGDGLQSCNIQGIAFNGTRRSGSKGIYAAKATGLLLQDLTFNWFGDQAVHLAGGVFDNHLFHLHVTGSCLVRARSSWVGCIDVSQTDLMIENCLASASCSHDGVNPIPAVDGSYGDGFIAAFAIRAGNCWVSDCMAHHAQVGVYVGNGSDTAFVNVRADDNQGHGWVIDGGANVFEVCRSFANGQDADGTYSAFKVNGGDNDFDLLQVNNFGYTGTPASPLYNRYKHAVELHVPNTSAGCRISNPKIEPYACTDLQIKSYGTQLNHATASLLNLADPNRGDTLDGATFEASCNIAIRDHKLHIVKPNAGSGARGIANERNWSIRPNYDLTSPGYSQLLFVITKDDWSTETPYMVVSRTGMTVDFIQFYNALVKILNGLALTGNLDITSGKIVFQASTASIIVSNGTPEGTIAAVGGSFVLDYGNSAVWVKTSGTGNTGWSRLLSLYAPTLNASRPMKVDSGNNIISDKIDLASSNDVTNVLAITNGGTGGATAGDARTNLSVYSKAEVDSLLAGKANAGATTSGPSAGAAHTHTEN